MATEKTLNELCEILNSTMECLVVGDGETTVTDIAPIESATAGQLTVVSSDKYEKFLSDTMAEAVIISSKLDETKRVEGKNYLVCSNPYLAFALTLGVFRPYFHPSSGIDERAVIDPSAKIGDRVTIQATVFIEEGAVIGDSVILYPGVYVGRDVSIGEGSIVYPNVSLREGTVVGSNVIINCNSAIGTEGFGYAKDGASQIKVPQTGIVVLEDDVEIGAGCMIDRAAVDKTIIKRGTKLDNLCHIAHNAVIGEDSMLLGQTGVSGSTTLGARNIVAGQSGLVGHISTVDDVVIGGRSAATKSIKQAGIYSGFPAIPHGDWLRSQALVPKLPEMKKKINELEKKIEELTKIIKEKK